MTKYGYMNSDEIFIMVHKHERVTEHEMKLIPTVLSIIVTFDLRQDGKKLFNEG